MATPQRTRRRVAEPQTSASTRSPAAGDGPPISPRLILTLLIGQLGVHSSMAGMRMAAPLQALGEGASTWAVGLLFSLFAVAPIVLALKAGRMADRYGFHKPMAVSVGMAIVGGLLAVASTLLSGWVHLLVLGAGALLSGAGANFGVLAIQRTAGLAARDPVERMRLFSWLGIAPSLSNVVGPVSVGFVIDVAGFQAAYALVLAMPLATLWAMRQIPPLPGSGPASPEAAGRSVWTLVREPGIKRLMLTNWLLAICWDVHSFAVPVIGHNLQFSASTIGLVLGTFTASVTLVRMVIPLLAHRLNETHVLTGCMVGTALIYAAYPFAASPWTMGVLSALLGITLGSTQPMVMSTLHHLTPEGRHGESLAFRSMCINLSSAIMPLAFGALGVAMGAGAMFWLVGAAVGSGAMVPRGLQRR